MQKFRTFHAVALGESHKVKGIPCQDAALNYDDFEKGIHIAAISDGHGSERHFMSEFGSKILVEVAIEQIKSFVQTSICSSLAEPFTMSEEISVVDSVPLDTRKATNQDRLVRGLISSIISNWNAAIEKHWNDNKPSLDFMKERNVPTASIDDYLNGLNLEYAYGCTLIAFAKTPSFWLAFQIGDGTCIAFNQNAETFHPIPVDNRFTGSTTASMCNEDAITSFRYCYGNTNIPIAIFLGSDGLDGTFGTVDEFSIPQLENFYAKIIRSFAKNGFDSTIKEIEKTLPALSEKGVTRDDMSLAGMIDLLEIKSIAPILVKKELDFAKNELIETDEQQKRNKETLEQKERAFNKLKDEFRRTEDDLKRADNELKDEKKRLEKADKKFGSIKTEFDKLNCELKKAEEDFKMAESSLIKTTREKDALKIRLELLIEEAKIIGCEDNAL